MANMGFNMDFLSGDDFLRKFVERELETFKREIEAGKEAEWDYNELVCPYCFYKHTNTWDMELTDEYEERVCEKCDKSFFAKHEIKRSIWSSKEKK